MNQQDYQTQIGKRILGLRQRQGLSQEKLADMCSLHRSHMGEIERGRANICLSTLLLIAQALKTTPDVLLRDGTAKAATR